MLDFLVTAGLAGFVVLVFSVAALVITVVVKTIFD